MRDRRSLLVLAFAALVFLAPLGAMPLQDPDEGRYGDIAATMARGGDLVTPHLDGFRYFEKPPLFFWITALSIRVFGCNEWAVRLPSALAAVLAVAATMGIARRSFGPATARLAGLVLTSAPLFAIFAHICIVDFVLLGFLTIALACLHRALVLRPETQWPRRSAVLCFYALAALATLVKGPVAVGLLGATIVVWTLLTRDWRGLCGLLRPEGPALYLAIAAPWFVVMCLRHPTYWDDFFIGQNLGRLRDGGIYNRDQPWWFYGAVVAGTFMPWTLVLGRVGKRLSRRSLRLDVPRARTRVLLVCAVVGPILLLSVAHSALPYYALPLFPPLGLLVADAIAREEEGAPDGPREPALGLSRALVSFAIALVVAGAGGIALSRVTPMRVYQTLYTHDDDPGTDEERQRRISLILPIAAPCAGAALGLAGGLFACAWIARRKGGQPAARALAVTLALVEGAAPFVMGIAGPALSERGIARLASGEIRDGDALLLFKAYYRTVPFYTGKPWILWMANEGEFGQMPSAEELAGRAVQRDDGALRALLGGRQRVLAICEAGDYVTELERRSGVKLHEIGQVDDRRLVTNRAP